MSNKRKKTSRSRAKLTKQTNVKRFKEPESEEIIWRFSRADFDGEYGWRNVECYEKAREILSKLSKYEGKTIGNILDERYGNGKSKHHNVEVSRLSKDARKRIKELFNEQNMIDELFSLRLSGKNRVWGVLNGNIFYFLWWDPDHKVCPALKD